MEIGQDLIDLYFESISRYWSRDHIGRPGGCLNQQLGAGGGVEFSFDLAKNKPWEWSWLLEMCLGVDFRKHISGIGESEAGKREKPTVGIAMSTLLWAAGALSCWGPWRKWVEHTSTLSMEGWGTLGTYHQPHQSLTSSVDCCSASTWPGSWLWISLGTKVYPQIERHRCLR